MCLFPVVDVKKMRHLFFVATLGILFSSGPVFPSEIEGLLEDYQVSRTEELKSKKGAAIAYPYIGAWISISDLTNHRSGLTPGVFRYVSMDRTSIGLGLIHQSVRGRVNNFLRTNYGYVNEFTKVPIFESAMKEVYSSSAIHWEEHRVGAILELDKSDIERHGPSVETRISYDDKAVLPVYFHRDEKFLVMTVEGAEVYFTRIPDAVLYWQDKLGYFSETRVLTNLLDQAEKFGVASLYGCRGGVQSNTNYFKENSEAIKVLMKSARYRLNLTTVNFARDNELNDVVYQGLGITAKDFGDSMFKDNIFRRTMSNFFINLEIGLLTSDSRSRNSKDQSSDDYKSEMMELLNQIVDKDYDLVAKFIERRLKEMQDGSERLCLIE